MPGLGTLHDRLHGRLWHTTHPERLTAIINAGAILSEPPIGDANRWKSSRGPEFYPFVRKLGGVSIFDFRDFDAENYDARHPVSSWRTFVPHGEKWRGAAWIEIDRYAVSSQFVSADALLERWKSGGHHKHTIMPRLEAAYIGDLPTSAFCSAFLTWDSGHEVRDFAVPHFNAEQYERLLTEWRSGL